MMTIQINDKRLNDRLGELHDALIGAGRSGDAATMMQDEGRLFLRGVINLTPPPGLGQAARKQGEAAVKRDLSKLFTPINEEFLNVVGSQFGVSGIDQWITSSTGKKLHLKWDRIDPSGAGIPAFHHGHQDSRGRVRTLKNKATDAWYAKYVVSYQDFTAYVARIVSHVGRRKGAWALSYQAMPGGGWQVTRWIARHIAGAKGKCINLLSTPNRPSVTFINAAPGIGQDVRIVQDQMRIRHSAIGRKIKGILSGYSADWRRGVKIQKQMRATA